MPSGIKHFIAVFKARTMEFVRDRGTFIWNLVFPIVLVVGFAFAIPGGDDKLFKVGSVGPIPASGAFSVLATEPGFSVITYEESAQAVEKLRKHQLDLVVDWKAGTWLVNEESGKSRFLKKWFADREALATGAAGGAAVAGGAGAAVASPGDGSSAAAGTAASTAVASPAGQSVTGPLVLQAVSGKPIRYVDWLIPGVIAMNMMFSSLFGVGFVLVRYRKNGVLKRLKATPVSAFTFVSAQAVSRLLIVSLTAVVVYLISNLLLGFHMEGNYLLLLLVFVLGALNVIGLGLILATRFKSEELVGGLMNLITFPMIILSGVFFSLEGSPAILNTLAQAMPLTHVINASRGIMLEGAGLAQIWPSLTWLGASTLAFFGLSAWLFKWE